MSEEIDFVIDQNGIKYEVEKKLGEGGQGSVYKLMGENLVLKVKLDHKREILQDIKSYKKLKKSIADIIALELPTNIHITKPKSFLESPYNGYIMELMDNMIPLSDIMKPDKNEHAMEFYKNTGGLIKRIKILKKLSSILETLRRLYIVYADLSPNNIYISEDPYESEVWLIDSDNMRYVIDFKNSIYTPDYGAPEVCSGRRSNDIFSDSYSFALIAFELLSFYNPFIGKAVMDYDWAKDEEDPVALAHQGELPWILDNEDKSNELEINHFPNNFEYCPKELMVLFHKMFSYDCRTTPNIRPKMSQWNDALENVLNKLYICKCGHSFHYKNEICPFCNNRRNKVWLLGSHSIYDSQYIEYDSNEQFISINKELKKNTKKIRVLNNLNINKNSEEIKETNKIFDENKSNLLYKNKKDEIFENIDVYNFDDINIKVKDEEIVLFTVRKESDNKYSFVKKTDVDIRHYDKDKKLVKLNLNERYSFHSLDNQKFLLYKEGLIKVTVFTFKLK